jgi:hypothetical protein
MTCRAGGDALAGLDDCDEDSSTSGCISGESARYSTSSGDVGVSRFEKSISVASVAVLADLQALFFSFARLMFKLLSKSKRLRENMNHVPILEPNLNNPQARLVEKKEEISK